MINPKKMINLFPPLHHHIYHSEFFSIYPKSLGSDNILNANQFSKKVTTRPIHLN